jgi:predicted nucleic acid-binding protein
VVTRFELLAGMRSGERHAVRSLLDALTTLDVTQEIADRAGEWARTYRQSHTHIGPVDYLIAATAQIEGANLATLNVRHYPMYPDLSSAF